LTTKEVEARLPDCWEDSQACHKSRGRFWESAILGYFDLHLGQF